MAVVLVSDGIAKLQAGGEASSSAAVTRGFSEMLPEGLGAGTGTLLPFVAIAPGTLLTFVQIALGTLLLVGLFTSRALVGTGALLVVLTFGSVIHTEAASISVHNLSYVIGVGLLLWLESADAWARDRLRIREEMGAPPQRLELMPPLPRASSRRWVAHRNPRSRSRMA
jgi:hypothetical protein